MQGVLTTYSISGNSYASYILGTNQETISYYQSRRNLNETIESQIQTITPIPDYTQISDKEFKNRLIEVLHTACYLSFIALKAQTMTIEQVLGDEGVVHELTHYLTGENEKPLTFVRGLINDLQMKAIGLYTPV